MTNVLNLLSVNFHKKVYINSFLIFVFFIIAKIPTYDLAIRGDIETYLIIAQNYLKGDFRTLIDNKPPLLYIPYIVINYFSKDNFLLLNIFASIPIFIGSYLIYFSCEDRSKVLAPIIFIFSSTYLIHGGKNLTSEHIVIIPIIISYIILKDIRNKNFFKFLLAGLFLTLAVFIRQNIALLYIGVLIYLLINFKKFSIINILFFLIGSLIVPITLIIYFFSINELNFLINTIIAPLYLPANENLFLNFYTIILLGLHIINFDIGNFSNNLNIFNSISLYFLSFYIFLIVLFRDKKYLLSTYIISISLGIFLSRLPNTHYLIQILPFLSMLINDFKFGNYKLAYRVIYYLNITFLILVISNLYFNNQYRNNLGSIKDQNKLKNWILNNLDKNEKIYLLNGHSLYNHVPQNTLTNFAHPYNIYKNKYLKYINNDKNYTTLDEWKKIKKQKPKFIVTYKSSDIESIIRKLNLINDNDVLYKKSFEIGIYRITPFSFY